MIFILDYTRCHLISVFDYEKNELDLFFGTRISMSDFLTDSFKLFNIRTEEDTSVDKDQLASMKK